MEEPILIGYHATDIECVEPIEQEGFKPSISYDNITQWLGKGIYFFEDLYYAVEWTIIGIKSIEIHNYDDLCNYAAIFKVGIDSINYEIIDFSSPIGYSIYLELISKLKEKYSKRKYQHIIQKGDANIIRVLEKLEEKEKVPYLSNFDVICATYPKIINRKSKRNKKGDFITDIQKQICVKNSNAIINKENVALRDKTIENLFELIMNNRRQIHGKQPRVN